MLGIVEELTKSGTLKWKNIFANSFKSKLGPFDVKIDWPRDGKPSLCVMSEFICLFHLENWKSYLVGMDGIEPSTSVLSGQRSTTELHARAKGHSTLRVSDSMSGQAKTMLLYIS